MASKAQLRGSGPIWAAHIRREFDTLVQALSGVGTSSLVQQLATEAIYADNGKLVTSTGEAGYSWDPSAQDKKNARDPVQARIAAAGSSLGRVLAGGQCDHRAYLAFLEAIYQVATNQDRNISARIEELWARADQEIEEQIVLEREARSFLRRAWDAIVAWLKGPDSYHERG